MEHDFKKVENSKDKYGFIAMQCIYCKLYTHDNGFYQYYSYSSNPWEWEIYGSHHHDEKDMYRLISCNEVILKNIIE